MKELMAICSAIAGCEMRIASCRLRITNYGFHNHLESRFTLHMRVYTQPRKNENPLIPCLPQQFPFFAIYLKADARYPFLREIHAHHAEVPLIQRKIAPGLFHPPGAHWQVGVARKPVRFSLERRGTKLPKRQGPTPRAIKSSTHCMRRGKIAREQGNAPRSVTRR